VKSDVVDKASERVISDRAMKWVSAATLAACLTLPTPAIVHADVIVAARPEFGVQAGDETYELSYSVPGASNGVASKLTYPWNATVGGVSVSVEADTYVFFASAYTNLRDPWGKMVDSDYLTRRAGDAVGLDEFSHTESRTESRLWDAELGAAVRVGPIDGPTRVSLLAGFRYESNHHRVFGASGWQLDASGNRIDVSLPDELALDYQSRYRILFFGARYEGKPSEAFRFVSEARLLGSSSSHVDDHVLRHKLAEASPLGIGIALSAAPMMRVAHGVHLGLDAQVQYLTSVSGTLSQHYYADDPFLPGDQTTLSIPDADFGFHAVRGRLMLFGQAEF
jgi:hypothetical protein